MALKRICEFIRCAETAGGEAETRREGMPSIVPTSALHEPANKWPEYGKPTFVLSDLERASQCAYFDYQRERVYVRTNKRFRRINRRSKRPRLPFTPNKRVVIESKACPVCGRDNIKRRHRLRLKTVDLKFLRGGVKRWIVAYRSWGYRCEDCGARFRPTDWPEGRALYRPGLAC